MTTALVAVVLIGLTCAAIATHTPVDRATFDAPTEDAIEEAVAIVDDGKALVRETEEFLEGRWPR